MGTVDRTFRFRNGERTELIDRMNRNLTLEDFAPPEPYWNRPLQLRPDPSFLVFQGGGAKGIVHVGALAAVEDLGIEIKGVAGTSAGAMIAALVAAGFTSKEMLDTTSGQHIIASLGASFGRTRPFSLVRATDLFSWKGWMFIRTLKRMLPLAKYFQVALIAVVALLGALEYFRPFVGMFVGIGGLLFAYWVYKNLKQGVSRVDRVRDFIDHAIVSKLNGKHRSDVTFRQLHEAGGKALKVVATNVTDQCVEVFSYQRTPEVPIADAVASSICLPVVFEPWKFACQRSAGVRADEEEREFLDGGLTSNLPVWTLDSDRAAAGQLPTIAFSIQPDQQDHDRPGHWASALMSAIISGSMEIHTRAVDKMVHIPIGCSLKIFDFNAKLATLCEAVDKARNGVADRLERQLIEFPEILRTGCKQLCEAAVELWKQEPQIWWSNPPAEPARFGVAFAVQAPREWQMTTPFHYGFGDGSELLVKQKHLLGVWEDLEPAYVQSGPTDYYILVPVSTFDSNVESVERKHEQPLVVIIGIRDLRVKLDSASRSEFESFVWALGASVVVFAKERRILEAVQRSTQTS
ncbi:hypothetical protein WL00_30850 [Burkholderia cepacia]|nr:hypothetical protein WL00_30850 [Burkholderia cepacia]